MTYRFKDTGGSRDTHETDTRTSQTNLKTIVIERHRGEPGHTRDTRAHTGTRITDQTDEPHNHPYRYLSTN